MELLAITAVLVLGASAAPAGPAGSAGPVVDGAYETPLGRVAITAAGDGYVGRLAGPAPAGACRFRPGEEVLRATLLDDSLAGQVRVCLAGPGCDGREEWASAVLLVGPGGLSGALHVAAKGCAAPGGKSGLAFVRAAPAAAGSPKAPPRTAAASRRARARALLRDGAAWLQEGNFEKARARFLEAVEADPSVPEAYNGVGVTWRMRDDLPRALDWYKQALAADPDFGDAYYNMACVYALRGQKALALRYLQIAALNGYATADTLERDPDLAPLRGEPAFRALAGPKGR